MAVIKYCKSQIAVAEKFPTAKNVELGIAWKNSYWMVLMNWQRQEVSKEMDDLFKLCKNHAPDLFKPNVRSVSV